MIFVRASLLVVLMGSALRCGWGQGSWVSDPAFPSEQGPGLFAPGFPLNPSGFNLPNGDNFMWETPHTLLHLETAWASSDDTLESWVVLGDVLWGSQTHSPFFFWGDNNGGVNEAMVCQEGLSWSAEADTLKLRSRGGCACGEGFAIVGDVKVSDSTSAAFAMKLAFGGFEGDYGFGVNGIDTLTFLGPDQSLEACASFGPRLALVGWGLDSCCAHKEVPLVRVVNASDGEGWPGFGGAGTVALNLPEGTVNDSIGGLPVHESGGWFEDVAWALDGQALFAAGAMLNGNAFQPLLAKFNLDGTLDESFGEGGLSTFSFSSVQNHWLVSLAVLEDGRVVGLLKAGAGEDLGAMELHLVEWAANGDGPDVHVFEWTDFFTPGHLDVHSNDVAVVGTVGDVVSMFGPRQIGVASWDGESSQWSASGTSNSPFLLTGCDVVWASDSALHVSARVHSDFLATVPLPYALWADSSTYAIHRFVLDPSVPSDVQAAESSAFESCMFYPNPAADFIQSNLVRACKIWDSWGRLVFEGPIAANRLDVSAWPNGVYTTRTEEGKLSRFVVSH